MRTDDDTGRSPLEAISCEVRAVTSRLGLAATALCLVATAVNALAAPV